jgi:hypothetical protein
MATKIGDSNHGKKFPLNRFYKLTLRIVKAPEGIEDACSGACR